MKHFLDILLVLSTSFSAGVIGYTIANLQWLKSVRNANKKLGIWIRDRSEQIKILSAGNLSDHEKEQRVAHIHENGHKIEGYLGALGDILDNSPLP